MAYTELHLTAQTDFRPLCAIPYIADNGSVFGLNLLRCTASVYRKSHDWDDSALSIHWNSDGRFFEVEFRGQGTVDPLIGDVLSQKIPLEIASESSCVCGSTLELGDYSVTLQNNDFRFAARFFCPECKKKAAVAATGLKAIIHNWFGRLKKIEIKATGVGIERD